MTKLVHYILIGLIPKCKDIDLLTTSSKICMAGEGGPGHPGG